MSQCSPGPIQSVFMLAEVLKYIFPSSQFVSLLPLFIVYVYRFPGYVTITGHSAPVAQRK